MHHEESMTSFKAYIFQEAYKKIRKQGQNQQAIKKA